MSDSHEPSYYEIALTNRQVIVAFVILLVCLIAAFFSGVWVGRESGFRAAEQMAGNTPPAVEEEKEGRNLEELEFFEAEQKTATPVPAPTTAPSPEPPADEDSTLAEDMGSAEPAAPDQAAQDEQDGEPNDRKSRREKRREREEAAEERRRQAEEARNKKKQPAPAPTPAKTAAPTPPEPARKAGQVVIQVFSSPEKDQAERIRTQLVRGGQKAFLSPVEVSGRTMYRVRIGPFDSRGDAQKVAEQVRKGYKLDTWVTE